MFKKKESTRLGAILVSKGLITREQLAIATHEQAKRNRLLNLYDTTTQKGVLLGAILVELGFIDHLELKRGLNWQQRLRHVSFAMALCAPFMVFAPAGASAQTTSSSSSSSSASKNFSPITIQAENYATMSGVSKAATDDVGGGQYVASIDTGDWLSYSNIDVNLPASGVYKVSFRVATVFAGTSLTLNEAGTTTIYDTVPIPKTGGWQIWTTVERLVTLPAGKHNFSLHAVIGGFNVNWFKIEAVALATPMPLTVQAENYTTMSGVLKSNTDDVGGGQYVASIDTGDSMTYGDLDVNIPVSGSYKISYRVATINTGTSFTLNAAGSNTVYDTVPVPKTGGWQIWTTVERTVTLPAGIHNFTIKAAVGGFNLNWFKLEPAGSQSSSSVSSVSVSSAASSVKSSSSSAVSSATSSVKSSTSSTASSAASSTSSAVSSAPPSSTSSSASSSPNRVAGPVALSWTPPTLRENGNALDITELGGYEIRYKLETASNFTYVTINDAWINQHNFSWLEGNYIFQIAAFDKNGNYSNFASIHPR